MIDLVNCRICGSEGIGAFTNYIDASSLKIYCTNEVCINRRTGVSLEEWQSIPIKDHPLKDEIMELIKSGKVTIS